MRQSKAQKRLVRLARANGGYIRVKDALAAGIGRTTFYGLRDADRLELETRGLYRLADVEPNRYPDLAIIAQRVPQAVICRISALSFHEITTQIPHVVDLAVPRDHGIPRIVWPPVAVHRVTNRLFEPGIEAHRIDGVTLRVYSIERTLADCFKFRRQVGLDVSLEALKLYVQKRKTMRVDALLRYAKLCNVHRIVKTYLEALL